MGIKVKSEQPLTLVMWERVELNDRKKDEKTGEWVNTGEKIEKTRYHLRDEFGDKVEFLAGDEYRELEGSSVDVIFDITFNDYQNKNIVSIQSMEQLG